MAFIIIEARPLTVGDVVSLAYNLNYAQVLRDRYPKDARIVKDDKGLIEILDKDGKVIGGFDLTMGRHFRGSD